MSFEANLIISLLKLTEKGPIEQKYVKLDTRLPEAYISTLTEKMQEDNLIYLKNDLIEVDVQSRLKLALKAIQLGMDIQRVSSYLHWQEFEAIAAVALELNGYLIKKNVRFKSNNKRWEIDVVGCRKPLVICIDCKHWHQGMTPSSIRKIASAQTERTSALAETLPNNLVSIPCTKWEQAKFIPVILSLLPFSPKFSEGIPIVPALQMQNFIDQLPLNVEYLKVFSKEYCHLRH